MNHDLTLDQDATVASLAISQGNTFTASDGNARTLTLEGGGTLTNNGTLSAGDGTISTSGSGSVIVAGAATLNDVEASTGFNFGSENATVEGKFKIEAGGFVDTNPPTYGSSSALVYATSDDPYGRSLEWSATSGAGYPNNVTIQNGTTLNLSNNGASTAREMAGNLTVKSNSALDMQDMSAALTVQGDVTVNNSLILGSSSGGNLDVNGSSVTVADGATIGLQSNELQLGTSATLQENGTGQVTDGPDNSGGTITATRTLNGPDGVDVAGLGAVLTATSTDLGSVDITRGHVAQSGNGNQSIERYYDVDPGQNNSGLDATLTLNYADTELNGITEGDLVFFKSEDLGSTWSEEGFDSRNNTTNGGEVTLNGVQSFSRWTLGDTNQPLPVELASFEVRRDGRDAVLTWKTASETNNSGFAVQHAVGDGAFEKAGWVDGAGTTTEAQSYRFSMDDLSAGTHRFRLKQVDLDGTAHHSEETTVTVQPEGKVAVRANPHPVRQTSTVQLTASEDGSVTVTLYDILGRRVETLHEGRVTANQPETFTVDAASLAAGTYFLRVDGDSFRKTKRITVAR